MPLGCFYKWEDNNHGLDHKCGVCKTVLSSPRAKKTCLGLHEEVCTRYHKTLFFLGQSHHCDACHKTEELHDKRHRKIIKLVQSIRRQDSLLHGTSPLPIRKKRTNPLNSHLNSGSYPENDDENLKQGFSHLKDANTLDEGEEARRRRHPLEPLVSPEIRRAAKAGRKTAKHQAEVDVITEKDLEELENALHPDHIFLTEQKRQDPSQGLAQLVIENNITFNTRTFENHSLPNDGDDKKSTEANRSHRGRELPISPLQKKALVDPILQRLGLESNFAHATKQDQRALDVKLRELIYLDIVTVRNEEAERMQRMAGYWRFVNRRTYNAMVRMNEIWDWATGMKLPEIEEESEASEKPKSENDDTLAGSTTLRLSDSASRTTGTGSYDDDFDLPEDTTLNPKDSMIKALLKQIAEDAEISSRSSEWRDSGCIVSSDKDPTGLLGYGPVRSPGPNPVFALPSPSSSCDGPNECIEEDREKISVGQSPCRQLFFKPSSMWTTDKANEKLVGDKENRSEDKANRFLAPPQHGPTVMNNKKCWHHEARFSDSPTAATETSIAKDRNNRFKGIEIETAAPREEDKLDVLKPASSAFPVNQVFASALLSKDAISSEDFPVLVLHKTSVETTKTTVFNIGATAVKLADAKSKPHNKKRFVKSATFSPISMKSPNAKDTAGEAWTTVKHGRRN